jgi:hypothetical protein
MRLGGAAGDEHRAGGDERNDDFIFHFMVWFKIRWLVGLMNQFQAEILGDLRRGDGADVFVLLAGNLVGMTAVEASRRPACRSGVKPFEVVIEILERAGVVEQLPPAP